MKNHAILGLVTCLGLILIAGSANAQHQNNKVIGQDLRYSKQHAEFAAQHCEPAKNGRARCLSFLGCREDEKDQKTICEWAWKWGIEITK